MLCLLFFAAACFSFVHGYLQVKAPNQWTTLPVMPTARDGALALATATEIFVIGGSISPLHFTNNPVATVERFSLASKTWLPLPPLSVPRYYATGQVFSQGSEYRLIVIGGSSTNDTNIASVEVFDPLLNSWFPRTPMPTNRCCMASVLVSNEIYVLGGLLSDYGVNTIEVYDIVKDSWVEHSSMPAPRYYFGAVFVANNIYVFGGLNAHGMSDLSLKRYDMIATWTDLTALPSANFAMGYGLVGTVLVTVGGVGPDFITPTNAVHAIALPTGRWTSTTALSSPRDSLGVAVISNTLYAIGGFGPSNLGNVQQTCTALQITITEAPVVGAFSKVLLLALVLLVVYSICGCVYNYRSGVRGKRLCPHHEFWLALPAVILGTVLLLVGAIVKFVRRRKTAASYQPLNADDLDGDRNDVCDELADLPPSNAGIGRGSSSSATQRYGAMP
eukprot:TRINITY_DN4143_c0_g1_i1.p1 TRINITY_DN4143_c0_g1~~TRINITY_DN4143_c0_g1_i1.p1  ORF type:complete len:453 (+),score=36.33 TRINITY_DN4143_c0_g1_i1:22-1359(+)